MAAFEEGDFVYFRVIVAKPQSFGHPVVHLFRQVEGYGTILKAHNSHGECYTIRHEDGTTAPYDPHELRLFGPQDWIGRIVKIHEANPQFTKGLTVVPFVIHKDEDGVSYDTIIIRGVLLDGLTIGARYRTGLHFGRDKILEVPCEPS